MCTNKDQKKTFGAKINLLESDFRHYIRRLKGTRLDTQFQRPTVKHENGSVMVQKTFHHIGVVALTHRLDYGLKCL